MSGDFNLAENIDDCVPPGFFREDDGAVQHVMASSADFDLVATELIDIGDDDHHGLLVRLSPPAGEASAVIGSASVA